MIGANGAERIVVVSPHLDDGVLSVGASIASWSRVGVTVELLTVLACDPDSTAPAGGWDRRGGFATEGESARARRDEDRRACSVLGVTPVWLPYGSVDYDRHGDDDDVCRAVADAVDGADAVVLPGHPLSHPDHAWLAAVLEGRLGASRIGRYAEQPYAVRAGDDLPSTFEHARTSVLDRRAKWRAIRCYRSQLPLLGMRGSLRRGPLRHAFTAEWVSWSPNYPSTPA